MLSDLRKKRVALCAAAVACAAIFVWWVSSGYPTDEQICKPPPEDYDCSDYNILFAFAAHALDIFNYYGTAIATGVIAWFTIVLVRVGRSADKNFKVSERAYVKISHIAPGIYWEAPQVTDVLYHADTAEYRMRIELQIKNFGKTPAEVVDVCMARSIVTKGENLPAVPDYSTGNVDGTHAFLVTDDTFFHSHRPLIAKNEMDDIINPDEPQRWLYIFGYVEYIDKFGEHHRGGYARRYERGRDGPAPVTIRIGGTVPGAAVQGRNNLVFVDQAGYNYDITQNTDGSWPLP